GTQSVSHQLTESQLEKTTGVSQRIASSYHSSIGGSTTMTIVNECIATVNNLAESLTDSTAPRMGVHTISEILFCKRAGLLVIDQKSNDEGSEFEPAPALGGLPTHDVEAIR